MTRQATMTVNIYLPAKYFLSLADDFISKYTEFHSSFQIANAS